MDNSVTILNFNDLGGSIDADYRALADEVRAHMWRAGVSLGEGL